MRTALDPKAVLAIAAHLSTASLRQDQVRLDEIVKVTIF